MSTLNNELSKREILKKYQVGSGTVVFRDQEIPYFVTSPDMPQREHGIDLQMHLGYWGEGLLFVSSAVPLEYRPFVLWHELREYLELEGNPGSCLIASREELDLIPETIKEEYCNFRYQLFDRLVEIFGQEDSTFATELKESLTFWKTQIS